MDAKYVISGSDDTNVRLWKAQAAEAIGMQLPREKQATQYKNQLKERFGHLKEIRRIAKHKHLPKVVKTMGYTKSIMKASIKRKDDNVRKHSTPMPYKPARKKKIMTVLE
jgi:WD repeat and SOF domain-containing protein 1